MPVKPTLNNNRLEWPFLYHKGRTGAVIQWQVWVWKNFLYTEWGQLNGKKQQSKKECFPTSEGRSNYRDGTEQAQFEAAALYEWNLKRKYSETVEEAGEIVRLPMLAHKFKDCKKKAVYPLDMQPKLDGVRCMARWEGNRIKLVSRGGEEWECPHISEELKTQELLSKDSEFDGELYIHGVPCTSVTGWLTKHCADTLRIEYHVYDMPIVRGREDLPWAGKTVSDQSRRGELDSALGNQESGSKVKLVEYFTVSDEIAAYAMEREYVEAGYEGGIARLHDGLYEWGYRSRSLLKLKTFEDSDYVVTGCKEGVGKFKGCAIWLLKTPKNKEFACSMKCTAEKKKEYWNTRGEYLGKTLKVRHFGFTDEGIPWHPVGIEFRHPKDMDKCVTTSKKSKS